MNKRIVFLLTLFVSVLTFAGPISRDQARKNVFKFLSMRGQTRGVLSLAATPSMLNTAYSNDAFYVFNTAGGFVIASGEDQTYEILGYSDSGNFDPNNIPSNMKGFLSYYAEAIDYIRKTPAPLGYDGTSAASMMADPVRNWPAVTPIVKTKWNQSYPYNMYCPTNTYTGCVATAMAQVMSVHRHPQSFSGVIEAYNQRTDWGHQAMHHDALGSTNFDWTNMHNTYTGNEDRGSVEATSIANLMNYCGKSIKMAYGDASTGGSAALTSDVEKALKNKFGYSQKCKNMTHRTIKIDDWDEMIYNELREGRAVEYAGYTVTNAGHAFVCDGYDGNGLFHINWGWGGMSDGYFRLDALNPQDLGAGSGGGAGGYARMQEAVIGIMPSGSDGNVIYPDEFNPFERKIDLQVLGTKIMQNPFRIEWTIKNNGDEFDDDLYMYNDDVYNQHKDNPGAVNCSYLSRVPIHAGETKKIIMAPIGVNGWQKFHLYCHSQILDSQTNNYVKIGWIGHSDDFEVKGESYTVVETTIEPMGGYYENEALQLEGTNLSITYKFKNDTPVEYNAPVSVWLVNDKDNTNISDQFYATVPAYGTVSVTREFTNLDPNQIYHITGHTYNDNTYQNVNSFGWFYYKTGENDNKSDHDVFEKYISKELYATLYHGTTNLEVPKDIECYSLKFENNALLIENTYKSGDVIPAGTGVIVRSNNEGTFNFKITDRQGTSSQANILRGSDESAATEGEGRHYYFTSKDGKLGFYFFSEDGGSFLSNGHSAYLVLPKNVTRTFMHL